MAGLSKSERTQLHWLSNQRSLVWGGHLYRGEPISDPDMQRWVELGLIEAFNDGRTVGYRITPAGRRALQKDTTP